MHGWHGTAHPCRDCTGASGCGGTRFRALRMDVTPLRESRDFRLLFIAGTVFYLGGMVTYVAIPFQIYHADRLQLRGRRRSAWSSSSR